MMACPISVGVVIWNFKTSVSSGGLCSRKLLSGFFMAKSSLKRMTRSSSPSSEYKGFSSFSGIDFGPTTLLFSERTPICKLK